MLKTFDPLVTDRLVLRLAEEKDVPEILNYFEFNRTHLTSTSPTLSVDFYTSEFWTKRLATSNQEFQDDVAVRLFLFDRRDEAVVIGTANLTQIFRGSFQACYLGYGIDERHQGQGLMTEALSRIVQYTWTNLKLHRVMANHLPENIASHRVLEKLGFKQEGYAEKYLFINGMWRDHVLMAITNPNA